MTCRETMGRVMRGNWKRRAAAALCLGVALAGGGAPGATLRVNSTGDDATAGDGLVTLREALQAANDDTATDLGDTGSGGDVIDLTGLTPLPATIQLVDVLPSIDGALEIRGPGAGLLTIRGRAQADGIVVSLAGLEVMVHGLRFTNFSPPWYSDPLPMSGYAAIASWGPDTRIEDCLFEGNGGLMCFVYSPTVWLFAGAATIKRCVFRQNTSLSFDGIIGVSSYEAPPINLRVSECLFMENEYRAVISPWKNSGGATYDIANCTFWGNTWGVLDLDDQSGHVTFTNCTIVGNWGGPNAMMRNVDGVCTVRNTVIAGNVTPGKPDVEGAFVGDGNNFIGNPGSSTGWNFAPGGTDRSLATEGIATVGEVVETVLGDHGGLSQTLRPAPGSVLIDGGNDAYVAGPPMDGPPFTDQRGFARITGAAVEIGAVELDGTPLAGTVVSEQGGLTNNTAMLVFSWTGFSDPETGIAGYAAALGTAGDPEAYAAFTDMGPATEHTFNGVYPDGDYVCTVRAFNGDGASVTAAGGVTVETVPPGIALSGPAPEHSTGEPVVYTVTYTDAQTVSLAKEDITLITTGGVEARVTVLAKSTLVRTIVIDRIIGTGSVRIEIGPGTAQDAAGNTAPGIAAAAAATVDTPGMPLDWRWLALVLPLAAMAGLRKRGRPAA